MKAAVGPGYEEDLRITKNTDFEQVKTLFDILQSVILNHRSENCRSQRSNGIRAIKLSKAKVHVHSDSCFVLERCTNHPTATHKWEEQIGWFMNSKDYQKLQELTESQSSSSGIFSRTHYIGTAIKMAKKNRIKPEHFRDRIIFMSMCNDIDLSRGDQTSRSVFQTLRTSRITQTDSPRSRN